MTLKTCIKYPVWLGFCWVDTLGLKLLFTSYFPAVVRLSPLVFECIPVVWQLLDMMLLKGITNFYSKHSEHLEGSAFAWQECQEPVIDSSKRYTPFAEPVCLSTLFAVFARALRALIASFLLSIVVVSGEYWCCREVLMRARRD